jgi:S-adenosylmethionine-diacylgycerolhomoserine-N-methlytransferase
MLNAEHDALMDRVYRHQRHLYDFTRKYYLFGRDSLIEELDLAPGERVLEIGCGTARNLIAMARRYPEARLFGLDASAEMLKTAEQATARAGLTGRIRLAHGFAEAVSPALFAEPGPFGRVIFSYSLSMIPDWKQALAAAEGVLAPGGRVHVVDFGDFDGLPGPVARLLRRWLAFFHVEPRVQMLKNLESAKPENLGAPSSLRILPGRYAFVWSGVAGMAPMRRI